MSIYGPEWERCESPIEQIVYVGLVEFIGAKPGRLTKDPDSTDVLIYPQVKIRGYRADFVLTAHWPRRRLVIECDGKAYHSTDPQMLYDARRDKEIHAAGYDVIRLKGSDIRRNILTAISPIGRWANVIVSADNSTMPRLVVNAILGRAGEMDERKIRRDARDAYWREQEEEERIREAQKYCP